MKWTTLIYTHSLRSWSKFIFTLVLLDIENETEIVPSISHSQSEPVSLQPRSSKAKTTTTSNLLLQTVETVIKPESSALMQECSDEEDAILAHSGRFCQK